MKDPEFAAIFEQALEEVKGNHTPEGDYIEQDTTNRENYCKHGQFIGNPYGGDYLCHWCEMGE